MYKSVKKTIINQYGLEEKTKLQDLSKPIIIGVFPNLRYAGLSDINGYLKCIKENLKMYTAENTNLGYFIEDVPFTLAYLAGDEFDPEITEFLNNLKENDFSNVKHMFRNINIYSYCSGNDDTFLLMKKFHDKLTSLNYKEDEIKDILDEVGILQFVDNLNPRLEKNGIFKMGTCYNISDFYDLENFYSRELTSFNDFIFSFKTNENENYNGIYIKSFGKNSLADGEREHVFKDDYIKEPLINMISSIIIISFINTSITNKPKKDSIQVINKVISNISSYLAEYKNLNNKDFFDYTEEDLNNLYKYLNEKLLLIITNLYNIKPNSPDIINKKVMEINLNKKYSTTINDIYYLLNNIMKQINKIKSYQELNLDDVINISINNKMETITRGEYLNILKQELYINLNKLNSLNEKINSMNLSEESLRLLKKDLKNKLNYINEFLDQLAKSSIFLQNI